MGAPCILMGVADPTPRPLGEREPPPGRLDEGDALDHPPLRPLRRARAPAAAVARRRLASRGNFLGNSWVKPGGKSLRSNGTRSRSRPNSLSHRRRVAVRLLGIGGTEACDRVGVDGPLGRADINAWPRLVVEMPVAVGAPHQ